MRESIRLTVPMGGDSPTTAHLIAASLGLQVHMSVDRLDDLRLALDEAIAELASLCPEAAEISCEFTLDDSAVHIRLDARTTTGRTPDHHGLGWTVLRAITGHLHAFVDNGRLHLHASVHTDAPPTDTAHGHVQAAHPPAPTD